MNGGLTAMDPFGIVEFGWARDRGEFWIVGDTTRIVPCTSAEHAEACVLETKEFVGWAGRADDFLRHVCDEVPGFVFRGFTRRDLKQKIGPWSCGRDSAGFPLFWIVRYDFASGIGIGKEVAWSWRCDCLDRMLETTAEFDAWLARR